MRLSFHLQSDRLQSLHKRIMDKLMVWNWPNGGYWCEDRLGIVLEFLSWVCSSCRCCSSGCISSRIGGANMLHHDISPVHFPFHLPKCRVQHLHTCGVDEVLVWHDEYRR
eukprot:gnl/TRDRNA2_/TRDRNA2_137078_c1_seq1.p2 gnl/TRDRNA2_/TRDRNA2_137078_c1~~gnl/TRDRNA2_/TRDRNA2_137078_c1_seq1.p2  ORF type:complete len:110 (+),score=7.94 gnl/TRDRNA2_/TRDRNA2_137078_c1_seq1:207-536(+)